MDRSPAVAVLAGLLGCSLGALVTFVALRVGAAEELPPPPDAAPAASSTRSDAAPAPGAPVDLTPVLARLDALAAQVDRLQEAVATLPAASGARVPVATTSTAIVDADSLQAAMDELERRRFDAMSFAELHDQARVAAKSGNLREAIESCERLVERAETPEQRATALTELAMMQRAQKGPEGLAEAEQTLRGVVDEFGAGSAAGRAAAYQLIWSVPKDDPQRGLAYAQAYVADPGLSPDQRVQGRWALAIQQHAAGDVVAARAGFERLLGELGDQPHYGKLVADIRQRLGDR
ncbi:MAG: hypothetical protein H6835_10630 [Planctomycetes bacterium]|nr:hypothetical protein [Planctomycetota bacterium]